MLRVMGIKIALVHLDFFVILDFERAVEQQTKARDRIWSIVGSILPNHLNMIKNRALWCSSCSF